MLSEIEKKMLTKREEASFLPNPNAIRREGWQKKNVMTKINSAGIQCDADVML